MVRALRQRPFYEPLIVALLLILAAVYINHLRTAVTPSNIIFTIDAFDFPVYWYGIWIAGGIGLGAYVVATIANERLDATFQQHVPQSLQQMPLAELGLAPAIEAKLAQQTLQTIGQLLQRWGRNPQPLGLSGADLQQVETALLAQPEVDPSWLEAAPWRQWDPDHVWNGLLWCLIPAVIGARLYHVLTPPPSMAAIGIHSPLDYFQNPYQLINLRNGGLGIYGGIAGGALGLALFTWRQRLSTSVWADLAVIGVALGQVFGRWGNFFNQELYGRPTDLPWAVYIDAAHRLPAYQQFSRFHPAFLYESLWSLLTFVILLLLFKRVGERLRPGDLTGSYLIFYAIGRTLLELVRLDSRTVVVAGLAINIAVATLVSLGVALVMAIWLGGRRLV